MNILIAILAIAFADPYTAKVVAVYDGDTITVRKPVTPGSESLETVKIRLDGIDAPELKQPHGQATKQALSELVFGKEITVKPLSKDRYGRTLARLELNGDVSLQLVANGHAWWYQQYAKNDTRLASAEAKAKAEKLGLWANPNAIAPWEFRKKKVKQ